MPAPIRTPVVNAAACRLEHTSVVAMPSIVGLDPFGPVGRLAY